MEMNGGGESIVVKMVCGVQARDEWCVITHTLDNNIHLLLFDVTKQTLVMGVDQR